LACLGGAFDQFLPAPFVFTTPTLRRTASLPASKSTSRQRSGHAPGL
jgi:hypothetical protein